MKGLLRKTAKVILVLVAVIAALFLLGFVLTMGDYPVPKTVAEDPSLLPRITINGVVFHAETFGDPAKPVVIVVHGGPGWDYLSLLPLKALADEYFVVFYDQRGAGLSPRTDPKQITLESSLQDLDAFVDYFGKGRKVDLIGHSWGAMLVSGYLGKHPEKASHAVLAEPGFLTTEMMKEAGVRFGPRWEIGFLARAAKAWFQSLHVKGPDKDAAADYFMGQVAPYANTEYFCNGAVPEAGIVHWRVGTKAMQAVLASAMDAQGNFHIDLIEGIDRFKRPVLFLSSECNSRIGIRHQEKQAKFFPHAKLVVIAGSGHMMFGERPAESMAVVREYLRTK